MRGRRKRNYFSPEQIEALRSNPYTHTVTSCSIRFTLTFKELFWQRYQNGEMVKDIFRSFGYDVDTLGDGRIYNFSHQLALAMEKGKDLSSSYEDNSQAVSPKRLTNMEHELIYLRQQVEFLKKLSSLDGQRKPKK